MKIPRIPSAHASPLWVDNSAAQDIVRLLFLVLLLRLYLPDDSDFIQAYRHNRSRASQFFDDFVSGIIQPTNNELQRRLNALLPGLTSAHLYVADEPGTNKVYFVSLARNHDGLWRLRHRKIRLAPRLLARTGVFASWNSHVPHPDVVCIQRPVLERVVTGGQSCTAFIDEVETTFEIKRQLTHTCAVCQMFGCLHRDEIVTWHDPGRVVLRANKAGNPWTQPYGFTEVVVRPYARPSSVKARVTVSACASDKGLYTVQSPRSIQATIKGVSEYAGKLNEPSEKKLLSEILLSRLIPVVGTMDMAGKVNLYGLHYDLSGQCGVVGQLASGRSYRASAGLPLLTLTRQGSRRAWVPNFPLLNILWELIYDPSPDTDARLDRWYALTRVFSFFGVRDVAELPVYFADHGLPLPEGTDQHISGLVAAMKINQ